MKKLISLIIVLTFAASAIFAQQLTYKFANPRIMHVGTTTGYDNFEFDIQIKASAGGTYLWQSQISLNFDNLTLSTTATQWTVIITPPFDASNSASVAKYAVKTKTLPGAPKTLFLIIGGDNNVLPLGLDGGLGGGPTDDWVEITESYQTICTVKARIVGGNTGVAGIDFNESVMNGQGQFVTGPNTVGSYSNPHAYDPADFLMTYVGRLYSALGWSQMSKTTAGQWVSWPVSVNTTVWEGTDVTLGGTPPPTLAAPALVGNLSLENGATLKVESGKGLTVNGTITKPDVVTNLVVNSGGSLIQTNPGIKATVQRSITPGEWHFISSPISDAKAGMFEDQYLLKLNEQSNGYEYILSLTEDITVGKGYALMSTANANYIGLLNYNPVTFPVTKLGLGWNLAGNPFSSAIDFDLLTRDNVTNAYYVHINSGSWGVYGPAGIVVPADVALTKYIPSGQGFLVQATAPGSLQIPITARFHNAASFNKSGNAVSNIARVQVSGNNYTDEAVVRFAPDATAVFDGENDAEKLYGDVAEAAQIYTLGNGTNPLVINSLPETNIVPAGIHVGVNGTYTIALTELNDISQVSLEDTKTGIFTDLTKGSYTFNFVAGENEQRFFLHFGTTGIDDTKATNVNVYSYQNTVYVTLKENVKGDIFIYNMAGQLIATRNSAVGSNEIKLSNTGNYMVKVITKDNTVINKVFIQ